MTYSDKLVSLDDSARDLLANAHDAIIEHLPHEGSVLFILKKPMDEKVREKIRNGHAIRENLERFPAPFQWIEAIQYRNRGGIQPVDISFGSDCEDSVSGSWFWMRALDLRSANQYTLGVAGKFPNKKTYGLNETMWKMTCVIADRISLAAKEGRLLSGETVVELYTGPSGRGRAKQTDSTLS